MNQNKKRKLIKEFKAMQASYDTHIKGKEKYAHLDLSSWAWNYYNNEIKILEKRRDFWKPQNLKRFLSSLTKEDLEEK